MSNKKLVRAIIRTLNIIVPKSKKKIYLRSTFVYPDNIQAILDCLIEKNPTGKYNIECNGTGFEKYKKEYNINVHEYNSIRSFWAYLRSKYVIFDNGAYLDPAPVANQISVNVWHGVSFKKIGFYNSKEPPYRTSSYVVTYSDLFKPVMSCAFGVPKEYVLTTGEPRNDYLFRPADESVFEELGIDITDKKIIFWMPTYRQSKFDNKNDGKQYKLGIPMLDSENIMQLERVCVSCNTLLIIKWHGLQRIPTEITHDLHNVFFITSDEISKTGVAFYSLLSRADGLITDYSSVFINYLMLNRPVCFAYDDIDYYKQNRGFMFDDIESLMAGIKTNDINGIYSFINDISNEIDQGRAIREKLMPVLNNYYDNKNAERLLKQIGII